MTKMDFAAPVVKGDCDTSDWKQDKAALLARLKRVEAARYSPCRC